MKGFKYLIFILIFTSCNYSEKYECKITDNKQVLYLNDETRIYPEDHRFDCVGDVLYIHQSLRDSSWVSLDTVRGKRFDDYRSMIFYFEQREEKRQQGDSVEYFRLFNKFGNW